MCLSILCRTRVYQNIRSLVQHSLKVFCLCVLRGLHNELVNYIVDESPLRIDKAMPGTHQKIVSPDYFKQNPKQYCIVTAWNYFDQIRANNPWFKGIWIVPAPELRFV